MGRWRGDRPVPYQHLAILKHAVAMRPIVLHNEERKASRAEVKSSQVKSKHWQMLQHVQHTSAVIGERECVCEAWTVECATLAISGIFLEAIARLL